MKIIIRSKTREIGSVLLVFMIIATIMGITLASYLIMVQAQNTSVMRSQVWNSAMPVAEAGVEDGLQLLNKYAGNFETVTNWPSTHSADAWAMIAPQVFYVRRHFSDTYYDVYVTNHVWQAPVIRAIGYTTFNNPYGRPTTLPVATIGPLNDPRRVTMPRGVNVQATIDPLFVVAMAAKLTIDFSGKNVNTDSFHSGLQAHSAWNSTLGYGTYPVGDLSKTRAGGDVVTDSSIINSFNIGNANIKGQVKTGPKGSVAIGPNGSVGDKAWVESGRKGIQPGWSADDMNVVFDDVQIPRGDWLPVAPSPKVIAGKTYQYVFDTSGDYEVNLGITGSVMISTNVSVRLKITSNVAIIGGSDEIHLAPGARAKVYMDAPSFRIGGLGIVNESGSADNFYYFGTTANVDLRYMGNAGFIGAIYAPSAHFSLGGGGSDTFDFIGASITRTVKMNGHYNFHYDENLRNNGMGKAFVPKNWKEI